MNQTSPDEAKDVRLQLLTGAHTGQFPTTPNNMSDSNYDLHERDVYDSLFYIYISKFPVHERIADNATVIIYGSLISVLVLFGTILFKVWMSRFVVLISSPALLHMLILLISSNAFLIIGIKETNNPRICLAAAIILHHLHLTISQWNIFLLVTHCIVDCRDKPNISTFKAVLIIWSLSIIWIVVGHFTGKNGYDCKNYCWMSIEKGMLVSFVVPVTLCIVISTALAVSRLRKILLIRPYLHHHQVSALRKGFRLVAMLPSVHGTLWFMTVLSLEEEKHFVFSVAAVIIQIVMCLVFMKLWNCKTFGEILNVVPEDGSSYHTKSPHYSDYTSQNSRHMKVETAPGSVSSGGTPHVEYEELSATELLKKTREFSSQSSYTDSHALSDFHP